MEKNKIIKEETVFDDNLIVQKAEISSKGKVFSRQRLKRVDASTVLIYNTDTGKVILTRQFRYPIHDKVDSPILEIVAGKIDNGEDPLSAAIRESEEETGYKVSKENIRLLYSCFVSPGYTAERFYIYYATVSNADKISKGGGLEDENESIEVVEMDKQEFIRMIRNSELSDAKTYIAGLHLLASGEW
jgi:ADP-ribose pyrophosphatase